MPVHLTNAQVQRDLAVRDLTDPASGRHAIQLVIDRAVRALEETWSCEIRWCRGGRVVSVEDNYDNLGFDPKDVTRDARYTRYVDDRRMLRSHSSVRDALGDDAASVEEVRVLSETPCSELPPQARRRLGARMDQKNLLVRVVLRDLDRTLSDGEANEMRDRVYRALHQGTAFEWATRPSRQSHAARPPTWTATRKGL